MVLYFTTWILQLRLMGVKSPATRLLIQPFVQYKEKVKSQHRPFVRGIYRWPVDLSCSPGRIYHDVSKWKRFPRCCPLVRGIHLPSTGHRWIPLTKGQWRGPLMFLCCQSKQTVEQALDWPVVRYAIAAIWRRHNDVTSFGTSIGLPLCTIVPESVKQICTIWVNMSQESTTNHDKHDKPAAKPCTPKSRIHI